MWLLEEKDWQHFQKSLLEPGGYVLEGTEIETWRYRADGREQELTDAGFLPAEDQSLQSLTLLLAPNRLPMPMFYMLLAEARRAVAPGGILTIVTKDFPGSIAERILDFWLKRRVLHAEHFTSPEHWQLLEHKQTKCRGLTLGLSTFRRTTFT